MDFGLKGKRALVTASSRGLGLACAESLAAEGAHLFLCARSGDVLAHEAERLEKTYRVPVHHRAIDLAVPANTKELADEVEQTLGAPDVLINNVGGPPPSAAAETDIEQWEVGFRQVFLSSTLLSKHLVKGMRERGFGRIITITSLSVLEPIDHLVVSTAMRAAVTTFSKTLAKEVAPDGVTVNTVMPGVIHTQRIEKLREAKAARQGTSLEEEMAKTKKAIPMGRLGRPEELADLVAFLASTKASYVTGMNISVDGGLRHGW